MEKKNAKVAKKKKNMVGVRIVFSAIILFVLLLAEIYMMIHPSKYFEALVTVTVLLIAVLYILVTSVIQLNFEKEQRLTELIENIMTSEKAGYLLMQKNFEEFNERLEFLEDNAKTPTEEIIAAQKAIAKVNISRNKENTDALMNSNDKVLERLFAFEDRLTQNNEKLIEQQRIIVDQANKDILAKQQESITKLRELELSIKNEILQSVQTIKASQPQVVASPQMMQAPQMTMAPQMAMAQQPTEMPQMTESPQEPSFEMMDMVEPAFNNDSDEKADEGLSFDDLIGEDTLSFDDLISEDMGEAEPISEPAVEEPVAEPVIEEPVIEPEEVKAPMPDMPNPNKMMTPDDIAVLLASVGGTEEPAVEEPVAEPVIEEPVIEPEEIKVPMPDMSNPNKMMTPDDIAALLASVGGAEEPAVEEPLAEPVIEEPVIEPEAEKPPMPDMSNPNKVMTPDEIAALLANLN